MNPRVLALSAVLALPGITTSAHAQVMTGEIYGRVTDASGAVLQSVSVTLTSPVLLQPQVAVTARTGTYRFPLIPIGVYQVKFELPGFKTVVKEGIRIEIGLNAQINTVLEIAKLEERLEVSAASRMVDLKDVGRTNRFTQEALQAIPSARDPWVIIEQAPGVAMDRQNVGGSASGQQSNFLARGATFAQQSWNLDGVNITDMTATGGSPVYFDFDAFEEMHITVGGSDMTMASPGVAINLVTKSGTDKLRGSARYYVTDDAFQSNNVTDDLRRQGASTGNPIQNIQDYGAEAGGPLKRGRAWIWGSYGKQDIKVGINNFFKADAECQAMKARLAADPTSVPIEDTWACLNSDTTILNNYNLKFSLRTFGNNQFSWYFNASEKVRNARDASDLRPIETTYRQLGVSDRPDLGSTWWKTGMPKSYKWTDRHIFNDRFMLEGSYSHVGNNFTLTFHEEALREVQPAYEITTTAWSRSYQEAVYVRPTDSVDLMGNYFLPGVLGGDHALKFGFKFRNDVQYTESMWGGDAYARFRNGVASEAQPYRRYVADYDLRNRSLYFQDVYTRDRLTVSVSMPFHYTADDANPAEVGASPFYGQPTFAGVFNGVTYTGQPFTQLPAMEFPGADPDVAFGNFSPRAGMSYDLLGDGRNVVKFNYARYVGGGGWTASRLNTVATAYVRYPWVDLNADRVIQANEIVLTAVPLSWASGYDYRNPAKDTTSAGIDPDVTADVTHEIVVTFDKEIMSDFAVSASYTWRHFGNFRWDDRVNWTSDDYAAVNYQPTGCPSGARCDAVTYYNPKSPIPVTTIYTNWPDYSRSYSGFEVSARKRMTKGWMMNAGFSYNDARAHYDSPRAYEDPSNIENLDNAQFAPESTSSGLGNVFVNAKWIFRVSGSYQTPFWGVNLAGFYNVRDGYPFIANIQTPSRPNGAGITNVYLDKLGDNRLPNFQTLDFRVDKRFTFGALTITPAMDVFNLLNGNTALSIRPVQNAGNANQISSILAPRVIRFGVRATW